jgi:hypothetical protein
LVSSWAARLSAASPVSTCSSKNFFAATALKASDVAAFSKASVTSFCTATGTERRIIRL